MPNVSQHPTENMGVGFMHAYDARPKSEEGTNPLFELLSECTCSEDRKASTSVNQDAIVAATSGPALLVDRQTD